MVWGCTLILGCEKRVGRVIEGSCRNNFTMQEKGRRGQRGKSRNSKSMASASVTSLNPASIRIVAIIALVLLTLSLVSTSLSPRVDAQATATSATTSVASVTSVTASSPSVLVIAQAANETSSGSILAEAIGAAGLTFQTMLWRDVPSNLSTALSYPIVVLFGTGGCGCQLADAKPALKSYVQNGGNLVLLASSIYLMGISSADQSWLGASEAGFTRTENASISVNHPLGTALVKGDLLEVSPPGQGGAQEVGGLAATTQVLATWTDGGTFAYFYPFGSGRVVYLADLDPQLAGQQGFNNLLTLYAGAFRLAYVSPTNLQESAGSLSASSVVGSNWSYSNQNLGGGLASLQITPSPNFQPNPPPFLGSIASLGYTASSCHNAFSINPSGQLATCFDVTMSTLNSTGGDVVLVLDLTPGAVVGTANCIAASLSVVGLTTQGQQTFPLTSAAIETTSTGLACQVSLTVAVEALLGTPFALVAISFAQTSTVASGSTRVQSVIPGIPSDTLLLAVAILVGAALLTVAAVRRPRRASQ